MSTEDEIRSALTRVARLTARVETLSVDDDLFAAGLTSQAAVELVFTLEDRLGVELPDHLITRERLCSIGELAATLRLAGFAG